MSEAKSRAARERWRKIRAGEMVRPKRAQPKGTGAGKWVLNQRLTPQDVVSVRLPGPGPWTVWFIDHDGHRHKETLECLPRIWTRIENQPDLRPALRREWHATPHPRDRWVYQERPPTTLT